MNVCIAGLGAIGSVLASRLGARGHRIAALARGMTLEHLRDQPVIVRDVDGEFVTRVCVEPSDMGPQDVIFLCCKSHDLPNLAPQVAPLVGDRTIIVPAINGIPWWFMAGVDAPGAESPIAAVDPRGDLARYLPTRAVVGSVVYISAMVEGVGVVRSTTPHRMIIGDIQGGGCSPDSERLDLVGGLLRDAGISVEVAPVLRDEIWTKILGNLSAGPLSVLTRATLGEIYSNAELSGVARQVMNEIMTVAAAYQARLTLSPDRFMAMAKGYADVKTSMLQDIEKNRPLELAAIADAVMELGARHGIEMPTTRLLTLLARQLSSRQSS